MFVNRIVATIVVPLLVGLAALVFSAVPALAAPPETPETVSPATGITATTATLHGVLNPGNAGEAGSYAFSYQPSSSLAPECGAPGTLAPSSPLADAGAMGEKKMVALTGLEPNREYAFCIVAYSLAGGLTEPSYGAAVPFKTLTLAPEYTASSEKASGVSGTGATLEAQINPNNEETNYTFEYSEKENAGKLEGTIVKVSGVLAAEFGERTASAATAALLSDTTYYYRVVAENEKSKEESKPVDGPVESFTTAPETPETLSPAKAVTATTATLEGVLNPKATTAVNAGWYFAYNLGTSCAGGSTSAPEAEAAVKAAKESKEVKELQPNAKYTFCLVATNAAGAQSTTGNEVSLTTPVAPPADETETTSGMTPYEATLEAQVNPNNQKATYDFEYSTSSTLAGAITLKGTKALSGYGDQTASAATGHVLTPGGTYYYRAVAKNESGEETKGAIEHFTTPATTAPVIEGESSSVQSPFSATLEATVSPDYQAATCEFEYAISKAAVETGHGTPVPCAKSLGEGGPGASGSAAVTGLESNKTYYYRVSATNASGTTMDTTIENLETPIAEAPAIEGEGTSRITAFTAELLAAVIPRFQETTCEFEYATEAAQIGTPQARTVACEPKQLGSGNRAEDPRASLTGLAENTTYYYRVVARNATGTTTDPTIAAFTTLLAPAITPGEAQGVTRSTAVFAGGTVNPEGTETRYHVIYVPASEYLPGAGECPAGKACAYEGPNARSTPEVSAGSESTPQPVASAQISELAPGTIYHYALIATNEGATTIGPDRTFTTAPPTPPFADTGGAVGVSQSSATITGTVDTLELPTTQEFEFGTVPYSGSFIPALIGSVAGSTASVSAALYDLQPGTTYYYRTVATSQDGTTYGAEQSFTTPGYPPIFTTAPTPAFIPYTSIAALNVREAHENKTGTTKKAKTKKKKKKKKKPGKHKTSNHKKKNSVR